MRNRKERLTVTVDPSLIEAGNEAVAAGRASSLSGWVNLALTERAEKERKLGALAEAIADYEKEHGAISSAELAAQQRADRSGAIIVRGRKRSKPRKLRRGAA
jgi:hypothetical protein